MAFAALDAGSGGAEVTRAIHQPGHQHIVCCEEIRPLGWIPLSKQVRDRHGATHFPDLADSAQDPFAGDDRYYLLQGQGVALDRQATLDGT